KKWLHPVAALGIDMDTERVEAHPQHGFEISAKIFAVVHADAVEKIRPGQQAACRKPGLPLPGLVFIREDQMRGKYGRVLLAVNAEISSLSFEKIEHAVQQRLIACTDDGYLSACGRNGVV